MRIPHHWARRSTTRTIGEKPYRLVAWGHSDTSREEAERHAERRLDEIAEAIAAGRVGGDYSYTSRPLREQQLDVHGDPAHPMAITTRNAYGARVLNTARVMFVDIDVAPGLFASLFGGKDKAVDREVRRIENWVGRDPSRGFRVYRTPAGLRLLETGRLWDPCGEETASLLKEADADPLYRRLCHKQECFRARLSAKPWRIGLGPPPVRFPDLDDTGSDKEWCAEYERVASTFDACRFLTQVGKDAGIDEVRRVVTIHDDTSGALRDNDLA